MVNYFPQEKENALRPSVCASTMNNGETVY